MAVYDFTDVPGYPDGVHVGKLTEVEEITTAKGKPALKIEVFGIQGAGTGKTFKNQVYFVNLIEEFFQAFGEETTLPNGSRNPNWESPNVGEYLAEEIGFITVTAPDKRDPKKSYSNVKKFFPASEYDKYANAENGEPFDGGTEAVAAPATHPAPPARRR